MPMDRTITVNLLNPSSVFHKAMNVLPAAETALQEPPSTAALMQALANLDLITQQVTATQQLLQQCLQFQGNMSISSKSDDPPTSAVRFPEEEEDEIHPRDLPTTRRQSQADKTAARYSRWQDSMPSLTQIDFEDESMRIQDLRKTTDHRPAQPRTSTPTSKDDDEPFETSAMLTGDMPDRGAAAAEGEEREATVRHQESINNCFLPVILQNANTVHTQTSNTSLTLSGNSTTDSGSDDDDDESGTGRGGDDDTVTSRPYDVSEDFTERSVSRSPNRHPQLLHTTANNRTLPPMSRSLSKSNSFTGLPPSSSNHNNTPTGSSSATLPRQPSFLKARSQSMDMAPNANVIIRKAKSGAAIDELKNKSSSKSRRKIRRFFGSKGMKDKSDKGHMDESASSSRSMGSASTGARRNATWNEMEESTKSRTSPRRSKSMRMRWPTTRSASHGKPKPRRSNSSRSLLRTTNESKSSKKSSRNNKVTAQPKNTKSLNIFCSDMVSNDFILNKLEILKENTNIVNIELEDCLTTQNSSIPHCLKEIMEFGDRHWQEIRMVDELLDGWVYPDFCAWRNQFFRVLGDDNLAPVVFQTRISVADSMDRSSHSMSNKDDNHHDPINGSHHSGSHPTLTNLVKEFQKDLGIIKLVVTVTTEPSLEMIDAMTELLQQEDREWEDFVLNLGDEGEKQVWSQGVKEAIENLEHAARAKGVTGPIHAP